MARNLPPKKSPPCPNFISQWGMLVLNFVSQWGMLVLNGSKTDKHKARYNAHMAVKTTDKKKQCYHAHVGA